MALKKIHKVLTAGTDLKAASARILSFFDTTMLLQYDTVEINSTLSFNAIDSEFWPEVKTGLSANRQVLDENIKELKETGCLAVEDIATLTLGYPSKVLHIIAHLVDGFVGIDSCFYNLQEDSHWLSAAFEEKVRARPQNYWLLHVEAGFLSPGSASLIHKDKRGM